MAKDKENTEGYEEDEDKVKATDEDFNFDRTLDDYEEEALIDKGEYMLQIDSFRRAVKIPTAADLKEGQIVGERVPYVTVNLRHARDAKGKIVEKFRGRRYDMLFWDLRKESTRDEIGRFYRHFGYSGAYTPKYQKAEFFDTDNEGKDVGKTGLFYIGRYTDKDGHDKNSRPKIQDDKKRKKGEAADAAKATEVEF